MANENAKQESFSGQVLLTSIEQFHAYDSSEEFPNAITGRFLFNGQLDREIAKQAWQVMLDRQRIGMWPIKKKGRGLCFLPDKISKEHSEQAVNSTFHWHDVEKVFDDESDCRLAQTNDGGIPKLDMIDEFGYGIWVLADKSSTLLIMSVHHAYTDGPGGVIIIRDWLTIYHNLVHGRPATKGLGKLDFKKWRTRNRLGLLTWSYLKKLPLQWIAVFGAAKFVLRKFSCFQNGDVESDANFAFPGIAGKWLEPGSLNKLDEIAESYEVRLNSLMMVKLVRAAERWKTVLSEKGVVNDSFASEWIRVILPISIRGISDRHLPAANKATIVQIDRRFSETEDERHAAKMLDREIKIIVGFQLDRIFLIVVRLLNVSNWLLRRSARNSKPRGTVIFTNLGAPLRKTRACDFRTIGELSLIDFDLCGPIRSGTPINVAFQRHDDRARITLHYDRRVFSKQMVNKFLDVFVAELKS